MKKGQIRAMTTPAALALAPGLFEADTGAVVTELFENARRAGAGAVEVWTTGNRMVVTDDGTGITEPAALLRAGGSAWRSAAVHAEEPRGLGLYAVAERGCRIRSREAGQQGRAVTLEPRHFRGLAAAEVQSSDEAPSPHGTEVTVELDGSVEAAVARAARHLPLEVSLNGTRVEQKEFLDGALRTEEYSGVRIGVFRGWREPGDVNFLGRIVREPCLPRIGALAGPGNRSETWSVRVDTVQAVGIRLDRRKERVAAGEWRDGLQRWATAAIYRAMAESGDTHVEHSRFAEAGKLGVELPPPPAALTVWRATPADAVLAGDEQQGETLEQVERNGVVLESGPADPSDQAAFELALQSARAKGSWKTRVYRAVPEYEGYEWYDRLPKVRGVRAEITTDGGSTETVDLDDPERPRLAGGRPAEMSVTLEIVTAAGMRSEARLQLDVLFGSTSAHGCDPWTANMLVRAGTSVSAEEIAACCQRGYYDPEAEGKPWEEDGRDEFFAEAAAEAIRLLDSETAADDYAIRRAVREHVAGRVPDGGTAVVEIDRRNGECPRISLRVNKGAAGSTDAGRATANGAPEAEGAGTDATSS